MLAAGPLASVQLSCRPIELGESPGWRGRAGAGSGGGRDSCRPDLLRALLARSLARGPLARTFARAQWATGSGVRAQSPLTKPPDESLVACGSSLFFSSSFFFC